MASAASSAGPTATNGSSDHAASAGSRSGARGSGVRGSHSGQSRLASSGGRSTAGTRSLNRPDVGKTAGGHKAARGDFGTALTQSDVHSHDATAIARTASTTDVATVPAATGLTCVVCTEPIRLYSLGPCNHRQVCHVCGLRMRALYKRNECPLCKVAQPMVLFTSDADTPFETLLKRKWPMYGPLQILCETELVRDAIRALLQYRCTACNHVSHDQNAALRHVRTEHPQLQFCQVCMDHRKIFFHEHKLYTKAELARHQRDGDLDDPAFRGHAECKFCRRLYYSGDELYYHLEQDHFHCFICRKNGLYNVYYANYPSLVRHPACGSPVA